MTEEEYYSLMKYDLEEEQVKNMKKIIIGKITYRDCCDCDIQSYVEDLGSVIEVDDDTYTLYCRVAKQYNYYVVIDVSENIQTSFKKEVNKYINKQEKKRLREEKKKKQAEIIAKKKAEEKKKKAIEKAKKLLQEEGELHG